MLRKYDLDVGGFSKDRRDYTLDLANDFLEEGDEVICIQAKVEVSVTKTAEVLKADISVKGTLTLVCDRSLQEFEQEIDCNELVYFKYGHRYEELDINLYTISSSQRYINIKQLLYDMVLLSLPMKKIHPDLALEDEENQENQGDNIVFTLK